MHQYKLDPICYPNPSSNLKIKEFFQLVSYYRVFKHKKKETNIIVKSIHCTSTTTRIIILVNMYTYKNNAYIFI